jgi:hypothetical protein
VGPGYVAPFAFTGVLHRVEGRELTADGPAEDVAASYAAIMSEQ